jgi:hypothetical protein
MKPPLTVWDDGEEALLSGATEAQAREYILEHDTGDLFVTDAEDNDFILSAVTDDFISTEGV